MGSLGAGPLLLVMLCDEEEGHQGMRGLPGRKTNEWVSDCGQLLLFCPALKQQLLTLAQPAVQPAPNVPKSACTSDPIACPSAPAVDLC